MITRRMSPVHYVDTGCRHLAGGRRAVVRCGWQQHKPLDDPTARSHCDRAGGGVPDANGLMFSSRDKKGVPLDVVCIESAPSIAYTASFLRGAYVV